MKTAYFKLEKENINTYKIIKINWKNKRLIIKLFSCYCSDHWALYKTAKAHKHQTRSIWWNFFVLFHLQLHNIAIIIVQMCLAFKKSLSRSLQERSLDICRALKKHNLSSELTRRLQSKCWQIQPPLFWEEC